MTCVRECSDNGEKWRSAGSSAAVPRLWRFPVLAAVRRLWRRGVIISSHIVTTGFGANNGELDGVAAQPWRVTLRLVIIKSLSIYNNAYIIIIYIYLVYFISFHLLVCFVYFFVLFCFGFCFWQHEHL